MNNILSTSKTRFWLPAMHTKRPKRRLAKYLEYARRSHNTTRRICNVQKQLPHIMCWYISLHRCVDHLSCCCSLGAFILSYNHAANLPLGSSINFVTTSATQSVKGNSIKCGARKLGSNPSGPAFDMGKALMRKGVLISCSGLYQPVAT